MLPLVPLPATSRDHTERSVSPVTVTFTPAKHWSARKPFDRNSTLWGSFVVQSPTSRYFFAGDTAYDTELFRQIGVMYGPFSMASLPIGAYQPEEFMVDDHTSPVETVQIHRDIKASQSVAMHWGTFPLTIESQLDAPTALVSVRHKEKIIPKNFFTMGFEETIKFGDAPTMDVGETYPAIYDHTKMEPSRHLSSWLDRRSQIIERKKLYLSYCLQT